jgi:hypothetical protein
VQQRRRRRAEIGIAVLYVVGVAAGVGLLDGSWGAAVYGAGCGAVGALVGAALLRRGGPVRDERHAPEPDADREPAIDLRSKRWLAISLGVILSAGALITLVVGGTTVVIVTAIGALLIVVGVAVALRSATPDDGPPYV